MQGFMVVRFGRKEQVFFFKAKCLRKMRLPVVGLTVETHRIGKLIKIQIATGI